MTDKKVNKVEVEKMSSASGEGEASASRVQWRESTFVDMENTPAHSSSLLRYRALTKSLSHVFLPRLVKRNLPYGQSKNNISVQNNKTSLTHIWPLLTRDWFHVMLRLPTYVSITGLLCVWTSFILFFALIYMHIDAYNKDSDCGLGKPGQPMPLATAFAFSLETCTTVGYGLPGTTQAFFTSNCPGVQTAIFAQMTWSMMFNAFIFAFSYSVLSKVEARGTQVVFSDKLVIQQVKGKVMLAVRCYDLDSKYPIVESHVRMYVLDRQAKLHVLRLNKPNDDTNGMLYLSLPAQITHHIDYHSALSPRGMPLVEPSHGLTLRSADALTNNREEIVCPVCGESYGTYDRLLNHVKMNRLTEERYKDFPLENSHLGFEMPDISPLTLQEVKNYVEYNISEVIVVVEGIDPQLSGTFQSLQSYKYEDIEWEGEFEPCLSVKNSKFVVDLAKFYKVNMPPSSLGSAHPLGSRDHETGSGLGENTRGNIPAGEDDELSYDTA